MNFIDPATWSTSNDPTLTGVTIGGLSYTIENANKSYSFTVPTTGTMRYEVRAGDHYHNDILPLTKDRSDAAGIDVFAPGTIINVDYYMTVEVGTPSPQSIWVITGEFLQSDNSSFSGPLEIHISNEKMAVYVNYLAGGVQARKALWQDSAHIVRGHEYHMQIQAKFDQDTGSGTLKFTRDGVVIINHTGPMGFAGMTGVRWKEGIYRAATAETLAVKFRALSVTTGATISNTPPTLTSLSPFSATAWSTPTLSVAAGSGILSTATDHNSLPMTAALHTQASHGAAVVHADGSFTYTPVDGFTGSDSFTYTISDNLTTSSIGTINVTVS